MNEHAYDVVTMGSATQDVFAKTDAETIKLCHGHACETLLAYPLGTKILIEELDFQIGGGGTNAATTFARQELRTGFIGKLGKDPAGFAVIRFLKEEGIAFLGSVGGKTGYSVILDSQLDDRTILTFKGANDALREAEIRPVFDRLMTRWLYCSSMLGESRTTMLAVMRHVKERGGKIAFNPSSYQAEKGMDALRDLLAFVDLLILNKEEAQSLTGMKIQDVKKLLLALRMAGPTVVAVTDGARGAWLLEGARCLHVEPRPERIVETTGAGDAFGSGLVAGLARGKSLRESLLLGMLNAEHVIGHHGAKNDILKRLKADILVSQEKRPVEELEARR